MGFRINTNVDALTAYNALAKINKETAVSQLRIASGKRINTVADDTSGFNIGKSLESKITIMKANQNNISGAKNLLSTAEGALIGVQDSLVKIEGKMTSMISPTCKHMSLTNDINALAKEIQSVLESTRFNNTSLLTGSADAKNGFAFQVGNSSTDKINLDFATSILSGSLSAFNESLTHFLTVTIVGAGDDEDVEWDYSPVGILSANMSTLKSEVSGALGKIGNYIQRLDIKEEVLNTSLANAQSSYSRLFDADMAMEQLNATRGTILGQAATSMLSQLNSGPQAVLSLFR